jgi:hypothetical protein
MKKLVLTLSAVACLFFTAQAQTETAPQGANQAATEVSAEVRTNNEQKLSSVPAEVSAGFLNSDHNNVVIEEVRSEGTNYVIVGKKEGEDVELTYDANGNLVGKEKDKE